MFYFTSSMSQPVITTHEQFSVDIMEIYDPESYKKDQELVALRRLRTI